VYFIIQTVDLDFI